MSYKVGDIVKIKREMCSEFRHREDYDPHIEIAPKSWYILIDVVSDKKDMNDNYNHYIVRDIDTGYIVLSVHPTLDCIIHEDIYQHLIEEGYLTHKDYQGVMIWWLETKENIKFPENISTCIGGNILKIC